MADPAARIQVRRARLTDAPALARIHAHTWRVAYDGLLPADYLRDLEPRRLAVDWRRHILRARRSPQGHLEAVLVAFDATQAERPLVGFATTGPARGRRVRGFAGELFMLYVHPAAQGQGGGRVLFDAARDALTDLGFRWWFVSVLEANTAARRFYAARGLQPDGEAWVDHFAGGEAVRVMRYGGPLDPVWPPRGAGPADQSAPGGSA